MSLAFTQAFFGVGVNKQDVYQNTYQAKQTSAPEQPKPSFVRQNNEPSPFEHMAANKLDGSVQIINDLQAIADMMPA
ncbi:MAG: hypothetical protein R2857_06035 [Vampirovibrionales bacterium]|nr:hypothetical protein [Cyanobacteria bacterium HKST-UBA03]